MPQFDFTTLSVVLFSLLISVGFYYSFFALNLLPEVIFNLKFRIKKSYKINALNIKSVFLPHLLQYTNAIKLKHK